MALLSGFAEPEGEPHPVTAELITEYASVRPGSATRIGIAFEVEEGWHIYAQNPGDAGLPTKVAWSGPKSTSFGPLHYPPHHQFVEPGDIRTNGYSGAVVLFSELRAGKDAKGALRLQAKVSWLACKEICLPGKADLTLSLPVSPAQPVFSTHAQFFEHAS